MTLLRTLDLFTGVGGLTCALHGIATPVAYCDVEPSSRRVLHDLLARGKLPMAPVSRDVRTVTADWLRRNAVAAPLVGGRAVKLAAAKKPRAAPPPPPPPPPPLDARKRAAPAPPIIDMIVGGFPCVGFSSMGLRQGFDESQSNLFYQILRIADDTGCPALFLENVPAVLVLGMREVVHQLAHLRGYEVRWATVSARSVGAPHVRNRWYCLAVKPGFEFEARAHAYRRHAWTAAGMPPRMVPEAQRDPARVALMGNSVVPDAVRYAFLHLMGRCGEPPKTLDVAAGARLVPAPPPPAGGAPAAAAEPPQLKRWPRCGVYAPGRGGGLDRRAAPPPLVRRPLTLSLVFDPKVKYKRPPDAPGADRRRLPLLEAPVEAKIWSTPRHGATHASHVLTSRTVRDLPTQARFERSTPDELRPGALNPAFAEWLMGYPAGWTRAASDGRVPTGGEDA